ncbi:hypothetical protein D9M68_688550 [compost metagenome]
MQWIAALAHHRQQQRGQRRGVGQGRAGHARQQHRRCDGHVAQAATQVAEVGLGHGDDALGNTTGVHQFASQDKERHGQQREAVGAGEQVLRQQLYIPELQVPHQHRTGEDQREGDGHAEGHETQQ